MKNQPQTPPVPIILLNKHGEHLETLSIADNCSTCGFPNFNIWGVKQNNKIMINITCMKCGNPNQKIIHNGKKK